MTLHCAFIDSAKVPPVTISLRSESERYRHVAHIFRRHAKSEEQAPQYSHIHFTSDLDEVLGDPQVKLVIVCTHADSHFEYAKRALEAGKMCWLRNLSRRRWRRQKCCSTGAKQRTDRHAVSESAF